MLLTLLDEPNKLPVSRRVMRITWEGGNGRRQVRIDIESSDEDVAITAKIQNYFSRSLTA